MANNPMPGMRCPIDSVAMEPLFSATVLGRHAADYFQCPECRLIQVAEPHWLAEAYASVIAATDVGLVARNLANLRLLEPILHRLAASGTNILDVGGGYGLLCRALRDRGFACHTHDPYCENLFARGFEPGPGFQADVLLAFEVMEHITNPFEFVSAKLAESGAHTLIFSTLTFAGPDAPPRGWWYYAFETGQHVSFYHGESLRRLGARLGMHAFSFSRGLHVLSRQPLGRADKLLLGGGGRWLAALHAAWVRFERRGRSLVWADYEAAKQRLLAQQGQPAPDPPR